MDCARVIGNIRRELATYVQDYDIRALVQGLSGGIDSTLSCALAYPVCQALKIALIGRSLPTTSNKDEELQRARMTGEAFCDDFKEVSIMRMFDVLDEDIESREGRPIDDAKNKIRRGNIKARIRMIYLYNIALHHGGIVLSNDNLTELLLGFWTINGDVGDIGLIQNLWKTEVYELSNWIAREELDNSHVGIAKKQHDALTYCIEATPTDGLGVSNSDLDQLGAKTYSEVDAVLKDWMYAKDKNLWLMQEKLREHPVVQRHERSHYKRRGTYNLSREQLFA